MVNILKLGFIFTSIFAFILAFLATIDDVFLLALLEVIIILIIIVVIMNFIKVKTRIKHVTIEKEVIVEIPKQVKRTKYLGHSMTKKYHKKNCFYGSKIAYTNLIKFVSEYAAKKKKYRKCAVCLN